MTAKQIIFQSIAVIVLLALTFAWTGGASAGGACSGYILTAATDTWDSIAASCGVTVASLQAANPGLGSALYAGEVVYVPGTTSVSYVVQQGDSLGGIAMLFRITTYDILAANPQITDATPIAAGQVITIPVPASLSALSGTPTLLPATVTIISSTATPAPTPTSTVQYGNLTVTYGHGLLVRTGPGIENSVIETPFVSAVKFSHWQYRKDSITTDNIGFIWVEIKLSPLETEHPTGWILVRDSLGMYFTKPNIGPKIVPGDP